MQVPGNYGGIDAVLGENLFLSFHYLYEDKFLERRGGKQHPWRCCFDNYFDTARCVIGGVVVMQPPFVLSKVDAVAWANVDDKGVSA